MISGAQVSPQHPPAQTPSTCSLDEKRGTGAIFRSLEVPLPTLAEAVVVSRENRSLTYFSANAIAVPSPAALQQNGGRTPSAWGGFQRRSLFGASVAQRIGKIAAAWLGAWKFLRSRP